MKKFEEVTTPDGEIRTCAEVVMSEHIARALYDYFVCTHAMQHATERVTLDDLDKAYKRCCELLGAEMPPEISPFPVIDSADTSIETSEREAIEPPFAKRVLGGL